jgi:septal ring factor EnvC (AmiA/AmiB activator)
MTPEPRNGVESRLSQLERAVSNHGTAIANHGADIARIQSDVSNNTQMIRALAPLISQLATVAEAQRNLEQVVQSLRTEWREDVKHFDTEIEKVVDGQVTEQRDNRNYRRMLVGIGIAAVLSPIGTLVVAMVQNQ